MISISSKLYKRCRGTFLRCSEFDDDERLRAVFVVDYLASLRNGLPNSRSKTERIDICISYLIEKQFHENDFLLAAFILALRDRYLEEKELWDELGDLYQAVIEEINRKRQELQDNSTLRENSYGELIEAPVVEAPLKEFFISYDRNDKEWAEWIAWQLEEEGYTTVIQAWDFRPGSNFVEAMNRAAKNAERTLVVLSPDYVESKFTESEWNIAFAQDPTGEKGLLFLVKVREFELEGLFRQVAYIDLVGVSSEEAKIILLAGIKRKHDKLKAVPNYNAQTIQNQHNQSIISNSAKVGYLAKKTSSGIERPLRVFLCHAHSDSAKVQTLYNRLIESNVDAWLDKEKLLPGSDWELEIRIAVREADVVIVCLSRNFNQRGFRQKEVHLALDVASSCPRNGWRG